MKRLCQLLFSSALVVAMTLSISGQPAPAAPAAPGIAPAVTPGTWSALTNQPPVSITNCLLLTDGRVMCQQVDSRNWYALTPNSAGSYQAGTWSQLASMQAGYAPLYFSSAVLPDGRVIVEGGEYECSSGSCNVVDETQGAIYNPLTDTWAVMSPPAGWTTIGDAMGIVLANGTYMQSDCCSGKITLLNPTTLTWSAATGAQADNYNNEEGWVLLPDGTVLNIDIWATNKNQSERYNPTTGLWSLTGPTVSTLPDNTSHSNGTGLSFELGAGLLRPDGTVFWIGTAGDPNATGHTGIYSTSTNTWSAGPDIPNHDGGNDAPAALLPNGNILAELAPASTTSVFGSPSHFYETDGTSFVATPLPGSSCGSTCNFPSFVGGMLVLPTGQVLTTQQSNRVDIYTPTGGPSAAWLPTITSLPSVLEIGTTYTISGTQFNGFSAGAAYGDDMQAATNYPLIRITNRNSGNILFARTHDHSSMGVATGSAIVNTKFELPGGVESGTNDLEVVVNGIASAKTSFTTPLLGAQGGSVNVTISGSNFVSPATINAGAGVTVSNIVVVNSTTITANFTMAAGTTLGNRTVTVTSGGVNTTVTLTVLASPTVTSTSIVNGAQGKALTVTLTGTGFAAPFSINAGSGITVSNVNVLNSTTAVALFTIDSTATIGPRNVTVNAAGGTSSVSTFNVIAVPTVTNITPSAANLNSTTNVTLTGTSFTTPLTVTINSSAITVSNVNVVSSTTATATLTIAASGSTGQKTVSVTSGGATNTNLLLFTINPAPAIAVMTPSIGVRGASVNVVLSGTGFLSPMTISGGTGVTVSNVNVLSASSASATFTIDPATTVGSRSVSLTANAVASSNSFTFSVIPATLPEFNGDGLTDLIWNNSATGQTSLWLMNGISVVGTGTLLADLNWKVINSGDFNGDGKSDVIWYNAATGQTAMWLMNGAVQTSGALLLQDPNWKVTNTADLNGDGKTDLIWYNAATGQTAAWLMNGLTQTSGTLELTDPNWKVTNTADLNGDGKADLIWYNAATGQTAAWLMNGLTQSSGTLELTDPNWKVTGTADLNGDGKADLLWYNAATGQTAAWLMNGLTQSSGALLLTDPNWKITATADLNGDKSTDILWYNAATGQTAAWLMNGLTQSSGTTLLTDPNWKVIANPDFNGDAKSDIL